MYSLRLSITCNHIDHQDQAVVYATVAVPAGGGEANVTITDVELDVDESHLEVGRVGKGADWGAGDILVNWFVCQRAGHLSGEVTCAAALVSSLAGAGLHQPLVQGVQCCGGAGGRGAGAREVPGLL